MTLGAMDGGDRPDVTAHSTFSDVEAAGRTEEGGGYDGRWPRERGPTTRQVRRGVNLCLFLILAGCVAFEAVRWSSPSPSSDEGAAALGEGSDGLDEDAGMPPPPEEGRSMARKDRASTTECFRATRPASRPRGWGGRASTPLETGRAGPARKTKRAMTRSPRRRRRRLLSCSSFDPDIAAESSPGGRSKVAAIDRDP